MYYIPLASFSCDLSASLSIHKSSPMASWDAVYFDIVPFGRIKVYLCGLNNLIHLHLLSSHLLNVFCPVSLSISMCLGGLLRCFFMIV